MKTHHFLVFWNTVNVLYDVLHIFPPEQILPIGFLDMCNLHLHNLSFFASTSLYHMSGIPWWKGVLTETKSDQERNCLKNKLLCYGTKFAANHAMACVIVKSIKPWSREKNLWFLLLQFRSTQWAVIASVTSALVLKTSWAAFVLVIHPFRNNNLQ